jgi:hypothetical protein
MFEALSLRSQKEQNTPRTTAVGLLDDVAAMLRTYRRYSGE